MAGMTVRGVAEEWPTMSHSAVQRHIRNHLGPLVKGAVENRHRDESDQDALSGATALQRVEDLYNRADAILSASEEAQQLGMGLAAIRELRFIVELLAKLTGELDNRTVHVTNLMLSPDWLRLRAEILQALVPYPDARAAVAARLQLTDAPVIDVDSPRVAGRQLP